MRSSKFSLATFYLATFFASIALLILPPSLTSQQNSSSASGRALAHRSPEWETIQKHLPDLATASFTELEMQADILRARRFPEDALEYYAYALRRGAATATIYKKMGVTQLELQNIALAQIYFEKAVKLNKKDAEAWNNLGAVAYASRRYTDAISAYKHSLKLEKGIAVYHSNLGMAYFDQRDYKNARKEISVALKLDPQIFMKSTSSGVSAHVISPEDRARFCLEMAKTYALAGDQDEMLRSLGKASEAGMDLRAEMTRDKVLAAFVNDPRVVILMQNGKALRAGLTRAGSVQALQAAVE